MSGRDKPFVSVILPVLNEGEFIERCVRSLMENTYNPDKVEILVVDGGSDDGTRELVGRLSCEDKRVKLLNNPKRILAAGINVGIENSEGEILIRMDGHAEAESDFIEKNIEVLDEHPDAWCVGGTMTTVNETYIGKVIAAVMSSLVGVGNARWRIGDYDGYTDRVIFGAHRKEMFEKVGMLDETLPRTEDDDIFFRIHAAGGKVYSSSKIRSKYFSRSSISKLWRQYFQYGYWRIPALIKHGRPGTARQLVPILFLSGWIVLTLGGLIWRPLWYGLASYAALYMIVLLVGAVLAIKKSGFAVGIATPIVFPILHFSYGIGNLAAIWRFVIRGGKGIKPIKETKITR